MGTAKRRPLVIAGICSLFFVAAAIDAGCGSDSFTGNPSTDGGSGDGAPDGGTSSGDGSAADSAPGCLPLPSVQASDLAFCTAFAEVYEKCGSCEECRQEDVNNCAAFSHTFSDAFRNAIVTCKDTITDCDALQSQTFGASPCIDEAMRAATPTAAEIAAKNAYCATCADAGPNVIDCDNFFFDVDGGSTSGSGLLYVSDDIAGDIQTNCSSALSCNGSLYALCGANQVCNGKHEAPKTTCSQGLCKVGK